jgi:large subunit ribosomal protein L7/L12
MPKISSLWHSSFVIAREGGGTAMAPRTWSADVHTLGDRIASLSVAAATELVCYLEEVHGVRPTGLCVVPPLPDTDPIPHFIQLEPTAFDVLLDGCDPARRVAVIRAVREATGLGLKEARDLVDACPRAVKESLPRTEAEGLQARLEAAGARVTLRAAA